MSIRAKFKCTHVAGDNYNKTVSLDAVMGPENKSWAQATPSGQININISNPDAFKQFEQGKEYFVDFCEASAGK